jgi:hypothetical protein
MVRNTSMQPCGGCDRPIRPGDEVTWAIVGEFPVGYCQDCRPPAATVVTDNRPADAVDCKPCAGRGGFASGLDCRTCEGRGWLPADITAPKWRYLKGTK